MDRIEALQEELKKAEEDQNEKKITSQRGRLINEIRKEIAKIRKDGVSSDEQEQLRKMEETLEENVDKHKEQLGKRYKEEFVKKSGSILSAITVLPKGVSLAIQKIKACIGDLKDAKANKSRTFKIVELLKSAGLLAATPFIFTGKFLIKHWYLVILFITYIFNIPGMLFDAGKNTILKNTKAEGQNFVGGLASKIGIDIETADKTTFWKELTAKLTNPEELKALGQGAIERTAHLGTTIKSDVKALRDAIGFIRNNFGLINGYLKKTYGADLEGLNNGIKQKLEMIKDKIHNLVITNPNAIGQVKEINQDMREVASMLSQEPAIASGVRM